MVIDLAASGLAVPGQGVDQAAVQRRGAASGAAHFAVNLILHFDNVLSARITMHESAWLAWRASSRSVRIEDNQDGVSDSATNERPLPILLIFLQTAERTIRVDNKDTTALVTKKIRQLPASPHCASAGVRINPAHASVKPRHLGPARSHNQGDHSDQHNTQDAQPAN